MALARSLLFALVFYGGTVAIIFAGSVVATFRRDGIREMTRFWSRFHRSVARSILGIRTTVEGTPPGNGPFLFAAKHGSMFETIDIVLLLDDPVAVLKKELVDIPGWGGIARRYGVIPVDRTGGAAALRSMLAAAKAAAATGRPIAIFPEGTRVPAGETPPLQPGFAGLYRAIGRPVVPIAIDSARAWPRGNFVKRPGTVRYRFGNPIPPGLPRAEIEARVHAAINFFEA